MAQQPDITTNQKIPEIIDSPQKTGFLNRLKIAAKIGKHIFCLLGDDKESEKLFRLSELRNEDVGATVSRVVTTGFNLIPSNLDRLDFASGDNDVVVDVERTSCNTFKITTREGLVFHDWESSKKHTTMYWLMRDKSKKLYTPNTFFAASALNRSFVHGTCRFPGDEFLPGKGGVVIEAGAYVGYKAISFAQRVGSSGKVIVIEASPDNFRLLCSNIDENGLGEVAKPINCAVWNKDEKLLLMSKTRMKHTIVDTDELSFEANDTINAKSLDTIIDDFGLEAVDFLNLQLNGAEIEAIEGLQRNFHRVRYINIVSRHHREGTLVVNQARKMLEDRGCEIVVDCRTARLYNLTARVNCQL